MLRNNIVKGSTSEKLRYLKIFFIPMTGFFEVLQIVDGSYLPECFAKCSLTLDNLWEF